MMSKKPGIFFLRLSGALLVFAMVLSGCGVPMTTPTASRPAPTATAPLPAATQAISTTAPTQAPLPINNRELFYTYQGLTRGG